MVDLSGSLRVLYPDLRAHWLCSAQQTPGEGLGGCTHPETPGSHAASGLSLEKGGQVTGGKDGAHEGGDAPRSGTETEEPGKRSASISCLLPPRTLLPQQALRASLVAQW